MCQTIVLTVDGQVAVQALEPAERAVADSHREAVWRYVASGDVWELGEFLAVAVGGYGRVPLLGLLTDPQVIDRLALAGEIDPVSLGHHRQSAVTTSAREAQ